MTINDILLSKESLMKLNQAKFKDFKMVMKIYNLTKKFNEVVDIVKDQQQKLINEYATGTEDGVVKFENDENKQKFVEELEKIKNTEYTDIEMLTIHSSDITYLPDFSGNDMIILSAFIIWED